MTYLSKFSSTHDWIPKPESQSKCSWNQKSCQDMITWSHFFKIGATYWKGLTAQYSQPVLLQNNCLTTGPANSKSHFRAGSMLYSHHRRSSSVQCVTKRTFWTNASSFWLQPREKGWRRCATKECGGTMCRVCNNKNNTLLHINQANSDNNNNNNNNNNKNPPQATTMNNDHKNLPPDNLLATGHQVLLSTVVLLVYDTLGYCKTLLDSSSQSNFITERMAQSIRATRTSINMLLFGISHKTSMIWPKSLLKSNHESQNTLSVCNFS
jgi:hypothetical protein